MKFTDRTELNTKPHNLYQAVEKRLNDFKKYVKEKMNKEFDFDLVKGDTNKTLTEQKDFDIAYLDGGHSFETVKHDYNMCKQLPVVVFDDYFTKDAEVKKLLTNIKVQIKSLINLIKNIDEKFFHSSDPVRGGGITHLAIVIHNDSLANLPDSLNHVPIIVKPKDCMPKIILRIILKIMSRVLNKWLVKGRPHGETMIIVSGGPSFLKYKDYLKKTNHKIKLCVLNIHYLCF